MNDGLDTALLLPDMGEKPSKPYRTSPYTVRQYCALPYAQRRAVDAACDEAQGLTYTQHDDESSPQPYTIGRATRPAANERKTAPIATLSIPITTSPMTTFLHPAPSAALHTLNTPEAIHHDATHADSLATSAVVAASPSADILEVVSRYVALTQRDDDGTDWTHWGPSPFLKGDTHQFALNLADQVFKCFTSGKTGDVIDFIMFMEELSAAEAVAWHEVNFPYHYADITDSLATSAIPFDHEESIGDYAFTPGAMALALGEAARPDAPLPQDGLVYESTDYDRFHLLPENRVIDFRHLRKLVALIRQKNLLHLKPLDVTPEGGIIDGQHRWAAARELGLPFFYRVGQQLTEADITTLNIAQKNWTGTDYLHFWTVKQVPAYVTLTAFRQRHPGISFSNAKLMLSDPKADLRLDEFNGGRWVATDEDAAEQVAQLMERIATEVGFQKTSHTRFVSALYRAVKVTGFDGDHFLRKLGMQPRALRQQATDRQYLELFQELYNYKTMKENHIRLVGW